MGADMLLAIAASPRMTSGGSDASVDVLCTRVKERAAAAASEGDLETELYQDRSGRVADLAADALTSWLRSGGLESRDVAHVRIGGREYIATGGLSWGDAPTDAFSYVSLLNDIHAFDEPLP